MSLAGISASSFFAGLNPATSHVIREWDGNCHCDFEIRAELLQLLREERCQRQVPAKKAGPRKRQAFAL